jgi:hypothetical protein
VSKARHDDGIPPRAAASRLREMPDRLELLLRWCPEKDADRPLGEGAVRIRTVVEQLGTLDRNHYLESVRRLAEGPDVPALPGLELPVDATDEGLADCELPELLTRFRHVRAQSVAFLEGLPAEAWEREGDDPVSGRMTLGLVVAHWVGHDAAVLAALNTACAALNKT